MSNLIVFAQSLCSAEFTVMHSIHPTGTLCKFDCKQAGQWPLQICYLLVNSHRCIYEAKQSFEYVKIRVCLLFISAFFVFVCLLHVPVGQFLYTLLYTLQISQPCLQTPPLHSLSSSPILSRGSLTRVHTIVGL